MKPVKLIKQPSLEPIAPDLVKVKAVPGVILPIFYKGSIIRIGENESVEIDLNALLYEPRIQFQSALDNKQIIKVGDKK